MTAGLNNVVAENEHPKKSTLIIHIIPYSHFFKYLGPTSQKHTTFPNQGRDIYKSVNKGYIV